MRIFLSLSAVIRLKFFFMFSSTQLNTLSSSLNLSWNIIVGLQITGLYTVVYVYRHIYLRQWYAHIMGFCKLGIDRKLYKRVSERDSASGDERGGK
jgi:hypothetical protein